MKKIICFILAALLFVSVSGCGGSDDKKTSGNGKTDTGIKSGSESKTGEEDKEKVNENVKWNEDSVEITTDKGKQTIKIKNVSEIPKDYPFEVVPIMENAKIDAGKRTEDINKAVTYEIKYTMDKTAKDVFKHYESLLKGVDKFQKVEADYIYMINGETSKYQIVFSSTPEKKNGKETSIVNIYLYEKSSQSDSNVIVNTNK